MSASRCFENLPQSEIAFSLFSSHGARSKCLCDSSMALIIPRCLVSLTNAVCTCGALRGSRPAGGHLPDCASSSLRPCFPRQTRSTRAGGRSSSSTAFGARSLRPNRRCCKSLTVTDAGDQQNRGQ